MEEFNREQVDLVKIDMKSSLDKAKMERAETWKRQVAQERIVKVGDWIE